MVPLNFHHWRWRCCWISQKAWVLLEAQVPPPCFESSCLWQFIPPNLSPGVLKEISGRDFKNDSSTSFNFNLNCTLILVQTIHIRHWQLIRSKLERMTRVGIHWKIPTLGPRDLPQHWFCIPRPWRLPLGFALGQSLGPRDAKSLLRQISWSSAQGTLH